MKVVPVELEPWLEPVLVEVAELVPAEPEPVELDRALPEVLVAALELEVRAPDPVTLFLPVLDERVTRDELDPPVLPTLLVLSADVVEPPTVPRLEVEAELELAVLLVEAEKVEAEEFPIDPVAVSLAATTPVLEAMDPLALPLDRLELRAALVVALAPVPELAPVVSA